MWKPWEWGRSSNDRAVGNARGAATELSRRLVERREVEDYLDRHRGAAPAVARRPA